MYKITGITVVMVKISRTYHYCCVFVSPCLIQFKSNTNTCAKPSYRDRCLIFFSGQCFGEGLCVPEMKINIINLSSVTLSAT